MLPEIPKPGIKYQLKKMLVSDSDIPKTLRVTDVSQDANRIFLQKYSKKTKLIFGAFSVVWMGIFVYLFLTSPGLNDANDDSEQLYIFAGLIPVFIVSGIYANFFSKIEKLFMQQFASDHGFVYVGNGSAEGMNGALFNLGSKRSTTHNISGQFENHPINLFFYNYTVGGSGKSSRTFNCTVFQMNFSFVLPPVMLLVDTQSFGGIGPKLSFSDPVKLKPELDLDKQFDLYTQEKYEIEALQIFTPEFISKMMGDWKNFNIEFVGNSIIVFKNGKILKSSEMQVFFDLAKDLMTNMEKTLKNISGSVKALNELNPKNKKTLAKTNGL